MRWLLTTYLGLPTGFALYAISSHLLLQADISLPVFLFPLCIVAGLVAGTRMRCPDQASTPIGPAPWFPWVAFTLIVIAVSLMVYGSISSISRDWDGFVAWSLKAQYLTPPVSLDQPHFTDSAIYGYGLAYPLLQPLCLGAMQSLLGNLPGQLLFPILYVASVATLLISLSRQGLGRSAAWLGALAFALTPMWLNRGAGAVDSGYADLFLAYALILAGAGLLLCDLRLLFLGALLLPLIKPEGSVYALALGLITALSAPTKQHYATAWGLTLALVLWIPLRSPEVGVVNTAGPLAIFGLLIAIHMLAQRVSRRTMLAIGGGLLAASILAVYLTADSLRASTNPLLRDFVVHILDLPERLQRTPELLSGYAQATVSLNEFGLFLILSLGLLVLPKKLSGPIPSRPLAAFFVAGLTLACLSMLFSPDPDLEHVFRSRFNRLLLHWTGPGWLLITVWVFQNNRRATQSQPVAKST